MKNNLYIELNKDLGTNFKSNEEINWNVISIFHKLSEDFIEKYKNKIPWNLVSQFQILSESFIEKYKDKLTWTFIISRQKLSESFIEKHINEIDWDIISKFQVLSEPFMEKYKDKINWFHISRYQRLSKEFIEKYKDKLNFESLKYNLLSNFIDKDWFIAYTFVCDNRINQYPYYLFSLKDAMTMFPSKFQKIKVYYKDLITTTSVNYSNITILKSCSNHKIYGKRDETI